MFLAFGCDNGCQGNEYKKRIAELELMVKALSRPERQVRGKQRRMKVGYPMDRRQYASPTDKFRAAKSDRRDTWKEAIIQRCIVNFIEWDESDPVKSLRALIASEVRIALDPAVSSDAQALVDSGRTATSDRRRDHKDLCQRLDFIANAPREVIEEEITEVCDLASKALAASEKP